MVDGATLAMVKRWMAEATNVVVLTGAGISAESGVPTFRGWTPDDAGDAPLWSRYRPEELATPQAFERDPKLVWAWYDWRRGLIAATQPNAGHTALVELENRTERFALVTQNVDGHHTRAGSRNVLHLHGDIWTLRCLDCGEETEDRRHPLPEIPPRCGACGGLLRPAVVWFGETLPVDNLERSFLLAAECDLMLVVGTSALVYPAAGVAVQAIEAGTNVVEINPEPTPLTDHMTAHISGPAGVVLPELLAPERPV